MNIKAIVLAPAAICISAIAYGAPDQAARQPQKKIEAPAASPLNDFKKIVAHCKGAFDAQGPSRVYQLKSGAKWNRTFADAAKIAYDVRQTDSLVSPYVAELNVEENSRWGEPVDTEDEAKIIEDGAANAASNTKSKITWAYQDGAWTLKAAEATTAIKLRSQAKFGNPLTYPLSRPPTNSATPQQPIYTCMGAGA